LIRQDNGLASGRQQAIGTGQSTACKLERGPVVHGSAYERQSEGQVHRFSKASVFEHGEPLIVVHGQNRIMTLQQVWLKGRVGGQWACQLKTLATQRLQHGKDDILLLVAQMPSLAGVGVKPENQYARLFQSELALQVVMQ